MKKHGTNPMLKDNDIGRAGAISQTGMEHPSAPTVEGHEKECAMPLHGGFYTRESKHGQP